MNPQRTKKYSYWLMAFLGLFVFRVIAQLTQAIWPLAILPPFDSWQSGAMPYGLLLVSQFIIIAFLGHVFLKFRSRRIEQNPRLGWIYLTIGSVYFSIMAFRLVAGFSFASDHAWLGAHIPALFHLVLASFLLCVGLFHSAHTEQIVAWGSYPGIIVAAILFHMLAIENGMNLIVATFLPVTLAALAIIYLEYSNPYRRTWQPSGQDVTNDAFYMLFTQILLPRLLGFLVSLLLLYSLQSNELQLDLLWVQDWSVVSQAFLMLLIADFFRYWLHRLSHSWKPLWQLHAVHHSPHKLYWLNVSRFHPIEKTIQYLFDVLPFILVGVSDDVLAWYFVFYAVNGFFQHCNINVRMGVLNFLISGPQLHRWHHSVEIHESNRNYGNNLIVWDLLFGTWFLPGSRDVGPLGLINREYPLSFLSQLKTPFIKGLDKNL